MLTAIRSAIAVEGAMEHLADRALAIRLESITAAGQRVYAEAHARLYPESGAAWTEVGGGVAAYLEEDSAANGTFALGMRGPVSETDMAALEAFYHVRGARPFVSACPYADASLVDALDARGYEAVATEDVLVRSLGGRDTFASTAEGVSIRVAETLEERELWAATVAEAFAAPDEPTGPQLRLPRAAASIAGARLFLAYIGDEVAGAGELSTEGGVGWLSADCTLPAFRRRGVQGSLQRARLDAARDAGCDLAATEALPRSQSQRNMERLGFRIVYTRVEALGPEAS